MDKVFGVIILVLATIVALALIMAFPTMWLWNYLMPSIFGLKTIGFWQALWLNVFSGILFRSNVNYKKD